MKYLVLLSALSIGCALPAAADSNFDTPQYSGPSAGMDRGFDSYRDGNAARINRALVDRDAQRIRTDDRAFDAATQRRWQNTQAEMNRRRQEIKRANEDYVVRRSGIRTND